MYGFVGKTTSFEKRVYTAYTYNAVKNNLYFRPDLFGVESVRDDKVFGFRNIVYIRPTRSRRHVYPRTIRRLRPCTPTQCSDFGRN